MNQTLSDYPHFGQNVLSELADEYHSVFPQVKNKFPENELFKFPGIYCNFFKLKNGLFFLFDARERAQAHNIGALFKRLVYNLGLRPSTKQI